MTGDRCDSIATFAYWRRSDRLRHHRTFHLHACLLDSKPISNPFASYGVLANVTKEAQNNIDDRRPWFDGQVRSSFALLIKCREQSDNKSTRTYESGIVLVTLLIAATVHILLYSGQQRIFHHIDCGEASTNSKNFQLTWSMAPNKIIIRKFIDYLWASGLQITRKSHVYSGYRNLSNPCAFSICTFDYVMGW